METFNVAVLLLLVAVTASADTTTSDVIFIHSSACEPCLLDLLGKNGTIKEISIKGGESYVDPQNLCMTYTCLEQGQIQSIPVSCEKIELCDDLKAAYTLPGKCCHTCDYTNPQGRSESVQNFRFNSTAAATVVRKPEDSWGKWTDWTPCSRDCGGGRHSRMRECNFQNKAKINCSGDRVQIQDCNTQHCPVDGGWTRWAEWNDCSATCGNGTQQRSRSCTNPTPMYGGTDCVGETSQVRRCFPRHCPVDCVWESWGEWTHCSLLCGGGLQFQVREKQVEKYGGRSCDGLPVQNRSCNTHFCPINGIWTPWSNWTDCSESCGNGTKYRERSCSAPAPEHGGKDCSGPDNQVQECFVRHCPVHCQWLEFSEWSPCSATCDGGTSSRARDFIPSEHGGEDCSGDLVEIRDCNAHACPDPCVDNGHPCYEDVACSKVTDVEYDCGACPRGLRGDGRDHDGCQPVNECEESSPCFPGAPCEDLLEGYLCGLCPEGFTGGVMRGYDISDSHAFLQVCQDINECQGSVNNGGCSELRECVNTMGSFLCGSCPPGFVEDGSFSCQFTNPCAAGVHDCEREDYCDNHAVGQYHCYCPMPLIGNGKECTNDTDLDGVPDRQLTIGCEGPEPCLKDNCPGIPNSGQEDVDGDKLGDVCDDDTDNDGIKDEDDNCEYIFNPDQSDNDYDKLGNACDNCHWVSNVDQVDTDWDGTGDRCDSDSDGDGVLNTVDNCPITYNPVQRDVDYDRVGDDCDNCMYLSNRGQEDRDQDGVGDACESNVDSDKDGIQDNQDNCARVANADQLDCDADGQGDACDEDDDGDGVPDHLDNCPLINNYYQQDDSGIDGVGDACEMDSDGDGVPDAVDTDGDKVVDSEDNAPLNKFIYRTNFNRHMTVSLTSGARQINPIWRIKGNGTEVHQSLNSDPALMVGYDSFGSVEYSGTLYVDTLVDDDYIGIVFNYQSNRKFMLMSWKQTTQKYWNNPRAIAEAGLQIRMVDSNSGPSRKLMRALWHSDDTTNQITTLYRDPLKRGWEDKTPYRWNIQYSSQSMCMRLRVYDESGLYLDSGCVCQYNPIKGGRLGLYVFSQENVIFSNLSYKSLGNREEAELATCQAN